MMLTTPPLNRPNSAETPPLATVVSWIASSIAVSNACPRMFSLMLTPLSRNRFSKVTDPPNENAPAGPGRVNARRHQQDRVEVARGRQHRESGPERNSWRSARSSVSVSALPTTVTSSVTCAGPSVASSGSDLRRRQHDVASVGLKSRERKGDRVGSRRQPCQDVVAVLRRHHLSRPLQVRRLGGDGRPGQRRSLDVEHPSRNCSGGGLRSGAGRDAQ